MQNLIVHFPELQKKGPQFWETHFWLDTGDLWDPAVAESHARALALVLLPLPGSFHNDAN